MPNRRPVPEYLATPSNQRGLWAAPVGGLRRSPRTATHPEQPPATPNYQPYISTIDEEDSRSTVEWESASNPFASLPSQGPSRSPPGPSQSPPGPSRSPPGPSQSPPGATQATASEPLQPGSSSGVSSLGDLRRRLTEAASNPTIPPDPGHEPLLLGTPEHSIDAAANPPAPAPQRQSTSNSNSTPGPTPLSADQEAASRHTALRQSMMNLRRSPSTEQPAIPPPTTIDRIRQRMQGLGSQAATRPPAPAPAPPEPEPEPEQCLLCHQNVTGPPEPQTTFGVPLCPHQYDRSCLSDYLASRVDGGQEVNCPGCRAEFPTAMSHLLYHVHQEDVMHSATNGNYCKRKLTDYINRCLREGIKARHNPGFTTDSRVLDAADAKLRTLGLEGFNAEDVQQAMEMRLTCYQNLADPAQRDHAGVISLIEDINNSIGNSLGNNITTFRPPQVTVPVPESARVPRNTNEANEIPRDINQDLIIQLDDILNAAPAPHSNVSMPTITSQSNSTPTDPPEPNIFNAPAVPAPTIAVRNQPQPGLGNIFNAPAVPAPTVPNQPQPGLGNIFNAPAVPAPTVLAPNQPRSFSEDPHRAPQFAFAGPLDPQRQEYQHGETGGEYWVQKSDYSVWSIWKVKLRSSGAHDVLLRQAGLTPGTWKMTMTRSDFLGGRDQQYGHQAVAGFLQSDAGRREDPIFRPQDLLLGETSPVITRGICFEERERANWVNSPKCWIVASFGHNQPVKVFSLSSAKRIWQERPALEFVHKCLEVSGQAAPADWAGVPSYIRPRMAAAERATSLQASDRGNSRRFIRGGSYNSYEDRDESTQQEVIGAIREEVRQDIATMSREIVTAITQLTQMLQHVNIRNP
jgi:hypothetical protein